MATKTRIHLVTDLEQALTQEEADLPLPGLVDLRHKAPSLAQTQVLDQAALQQLRSEYEALRGPIVRAPSEREQTDLTLQVPKPRRFRLIAALLAILVALLSWSVCRSWLAGQQVARASTPSSPAALPAPVQVAVPVRARPAQAAAANLPRAALEALAGGDRELARRIYDELAQHEAEPGPYAAAAAILARELKAAE
jgi:hypothetical protein